MDKQEKKYPPGYHRNDYYVMVQLGHQTFALVKRELNREFTQTIFELREINYERQIDGQYYWVIGDKVDVEIKTYELIQWFGIACAADGGINQGLNPALGAQQSAGPSIAEQVAAGPSEAPPLDAPLTGAAGEEGSAPPDGDDDIPF